MPMSASAATGDEYVIVGTDGSVSVRTLTDAQAERVASQDDVRMVSPEQQFSVTETPTEILTTLPVPENLDNGDVIANRYIVQFSSDVASRVAAASMSEDVLAVFSHAITGFVAELDPDEVIDLQMNPNVVSVEPDRVVTVQQTHNDATWGLDRIDQRTLPLDRTFTHTGTGAGVTAYILDTGIYAEHAEFAGRVSSGFTAINDGNGTHDCHTHGTHVAGTVGGRLYGVAKQVTLVPVRVLGCTGRGSSSGIIAGIDWTITHHQAGTPAVANMSLGGFASAATNSAVERAHRDGIVYVAAAGNSNDDACRYSPASAPSAITVGASTVTDARASFSNWGRCVDVFAPGSGITSAVIGSPNATGVFSGTSMAAPHVAGVVALYLQANRSATPDEVTRALLAASTKSVVTDAGLGSNPAMIFAGSFEPAPPTAPMAPTGLVGTPLDSAVSLTWTAPFNGGSAIVDYRVEQSDDGGQSWTVVDDGTSMATSASVTGLTNYVTYQFRVSAVNVAGRSSASAVVSVMPVVPGLPSAPRNLTGTVGRERVSLSWSTPSTRGASAITDYVVEISTDGARTWTVFPDGVSTSISTVLSPLAARTEHRIRVRARNSAGVSLPSDTVTLTPMSFNPPSPVRSVVAVPRLLGADVSWLAPLDLGGGTLQGYIVDWSVDNGETWVGSLRTLGAVRQVSLTNLTGGIAHLVRVRAVNQYGTSDGATVAVTPTPVMPPSTPRFLQVHVGYNTASLNWSSPIGNGGAPITGYVVEHSVDNGATWTQNTTTSPLNRSIQLTNLQGGVPHQFRARAVNSAGVGEASLAVTATPMAPTAPTPPRSLSGFSSGSTGYLSWSSPSNLGGAALTGYAVQVSTDGGSSWELVGSTQSRSITVRNLSGGVAYQFRVMAMNVAGTSAPSNVVTLSPRIAGTPAPPAQVWASVAGTSVSVQWSAVTSTTAAVTDYVVEYSVNASGTWAVWNDGVSTATSTLLTAMAPDVPVSIRVKAVNRFGHSPASAVVTVVPRAAAGVPGAPVNVTANAGDTRATVRWGTPDSDGGSQIVNYVVTASPGGATCETGTFACVVTGLTNGTAYTFTVVAVNAVGTGPASALSNEVVPVSAALPPAQARSWGLDRADQRALPLDGIITRNSMAANVDVYVIDTGVRTNHQDFTSRVVPGFSAIADGRGTDDCHGHGTHVAGTIAGSTLGFATAARIVPVRVLDCNGSGSSSGVIAGINWMIQHHQAGTPAVANLSLGGGFDLALNDAIERAVADGITVVVAAGNESTDACTMSPASAASAITVGSTTSSDGRSSFSNFGACVDIFAPGSSIISAGISSPTATTIMSGTSMAAPHAAGVAAGMLGNVPTMSPAQVTSRLLSDATRGVVTGLGSTTVNALLYQAITSDIASGGIDDDAPVGGRRSMEGGSDGVDVDYGDVVDAPPPPAAQPVLTTPPAPATVRVRSVRRVGRFHRVVVSAPAGAKITLYRNGRVVATGTRSVFQVRATNAQNVRFHVVATVNGAKIKSAAVRFTRR